VALTIDIPSMRGKLAVVTGASDGIGLNIARRLAAAGAEIIIPVRSAAKGEAALARIRQERPAHRLRHVCSTSHRLIRSPLSCRN